MSSVAVLERQAETARSGAAASARKSVGWGGWWAIALAVVAGAIVSIRLEVPAFFDNEGRYAEVAREMFLSGDYVTPRMDGTLFLNKPPLTFWARSMRTTSAPMSARSMAVKGPGPMPWISMIFRPERGPDIRFLPCSNGRRGR